MKNIILIFTALSLLLSISGCGTFGSDKPTEQAGATAETEERDSVIQLYQSAQAELKKENYIKAAGMFDDVERQFPYSKWATRANLMAAYAHYEALEYDSAIVTLNRFIELHPGHKDIAYAHYLKALSFYEQIIDIGRDQKTTRNAETALQEVVRRFPDSEYARDAKLKLDFVHDHLAGKESAVGRFYLKRHQYHAAIGRFNRVIRDFGTTTHVPEALHRLVEAYYALGLNEQARQVAAVLGHNFPGSDWYQASFALLKGEEIPDLDNNQGSTWQQLKRSVGL